MNVMHPYHAAASRYTDMPYRRLGRSGLKLPAITLGLWQNFGYETPLETVRGLCRTAFDHGITHFDLANNYGPPYGSAELQFGTVMQQDLRPYRDELLISTKAGYDMWPGPYGNGGSRKYLLASLDQSLQRMQLDYVDIFYSHRVDPETPLEETMGALASAVTQGKALYVGISSYGPEMTLEAARLLSETRTPFVIHQPSYSLFNRWIESSGLLDTLDALGLGAIAFSPLAQGLLSEKYLQDIPSDARAAASGSFSPSLITDSARTALRELDRIAKSRGQSIVQLAISWVLHRDTVSSALVGIRNEAQLLEALGALKNLEFDASELAEIDRVATDQGLNLWAPSSALKPEDLPPAVGQIHRS